MSCQKCGNQTAVFRGFVKGFRHQVGYAVKLRFDTVLEQILTPFLQAVDRITYDAHSLTVLSLCRLPTHHPPRSR